MIVVSHLFEQFPFFKKAVDEMLFIIDDWGTVDELATVPDHIQKIVAYVEPVFKAMAGVTLHSVLSKESYIALYPNFERTTLSEEYDGFEGDTALRHMAGGEAEVQEYLIKLYGRKGQVSNDLLASIFDGELSYILQQPRYVDD